MGIGQRKKIQIVPFTSSKGVNGQNVETEGVRIGVWAEVTAPGGGRSYEYGQTRISSTRDFTINYRFDLFPDANWRIVYDGKMWTVNSIEKIDEKRFFYVLNATAKSNV